MFYRMYGGCWRRRGYCWQREVQFSPVLIGDIRIYVTQVEAYHPKRSCIGRHQERDLVVVNLDTVKADGEQYLPHGSHLKSHTHANTIWIMMNVIQTYTECYKRNKL